MFTWKKIGCIFQAGDYDWMVTHAQNPFPEELEHGVYRIHFASRDSQNRARGGYFDFSPGEPSRILNMSEHPTLDLGALGAFDDSGVMPSCLVRHEGVQYLYYTGWTQTVTVPFRFFIGIALSRDSGITYTRFSQSPVLGRTFHDPFLTASPWVLKENGIWRMWYVSGSGWKIERDYPKPKHYYHIRYAESHDGIEWKTEGRVCIDYREDEYAIARPVVYKERGIYKMWYCYRGGADAYSAGYAESPDGITWERKDRQAGIEVSESGWDAEMICYPCEFVCEGRHYLLYNGNGYGKTGIGLAVRIDDENHARRA